MSKSTRKPPHGGGGGTPPPNPIPAPTGLIASLTPDNKVFIQWNAVQGATTYWIRRVQTEGAYVLAIVTSTNFTDVAVEPNKSYEYMVAAVVNSVLGPDSNPVTIKTN